VIDFEGSRKTGIQQASVLSFRNFDIIDAHEFLKDDGSFNDWMIKLLSKNPIDFWVSHNITVEKNFLTSQMPYFISSYLNNDNLTWGPWIDTLEIYKCLYPNLSEYSLNKLSANFLSKEEINSLSEAYCKRTKTTFHQSLFDCLVTFKLFERLKNKVDLAFFLK